MPTKNAITGKAAQLLRKVARLVLEEPTRYDQTDWIHKKEKGDKMAPACGTAGCIAGWLAIASMRPRLTPKFVESLRIDAGFMTINGENLMAKVKNVLGPEAFAAAENSLFEAHPEHRWPQPFASRWGKIDRSAMWDNPAAYKRVRRAEAKIAASRIEHFIRTGK